MGLDLLGSGGLLVLARAEVGLRAGRRDGVGLVLWFAWGFPVAGEIRVVWLLCLELLASRAGRAADLLRPSGGVVVALRVAAARLRSALVRGGALVAAVWLAAWAAAAAECGFPPRSCARLLVVLLLLRHP